METIPGENSISLCGVEPQIFRDDEADAHIGCRFDDRYGYDLELSKENGWHQFDTRHDGWYFGLWIDVIGLRTFCYAEGDRIFERYASVDAFKTALDHLNEVYGDPPPFAISYDHDTNERAIYLDIRPSSATYDELLTQSHKLKAELAHSSGVAH